MEKIEKENKKEGEKQVGFWNFIVNRFREIFSADFLHGVLHGDKLKGTFKFWFSVNTIATFILTIFALFQINSVVNDVLTEASNKYPDAMISFDKGTLATSGIADPYLYPGKDNTVFVIDTKGEKYDQAILNNYDAGILVAKDRIYNKKSSVETREISFKQVDNFSISEHDAVSFFYKFKLVIYFFLEVGMFVGIWIFYNGFRLISAAWWALLLWIFFQVGGIKELTYKKSYLAILNLYVIPLLIVDSLGILGYGFLFFTTIVFLIIFVVNLVKYKKLGKKIDVSV